MSVVSYLSLARPYARAVFELAVATKELDLWSTLLASLVSVVQERIMQELLKNPCVDEASIYDCLLAICKPCLFAEGENFLRLVTVHRRLLVLPEIKRLFDAYRAEQAKQVTARVTSVVALSKEEEQDLASTLENYLQRRVCLHYHLDSHLLGGLIVQIGDLVIDNSVRGKLERLRAALVN